MTATDNANQGEAASNEEVGYGEALAELESILDELEDDSIDVDLLATKVERAAELIRLCRGRISAAEVKVEEIVGDLEALAAHDRDESADGDGK